MVNSKPNLHERETPQWERRERKGSFKCKRSTLVTSRREWSHLREGGGGGGGGGYW